MCGPWGHPIPRISAMICLLVTLNRILKKPPAPLSVAQTSSRTGRTHQGLCLLPRALLAAFFSILLYGFLHHCALIPTRPPRPREIRAAVPTKTTIRTPITDGRLRSKLIQASWSAIRQDGELREFFRSVCRRHPRGVGARVAIVAVARKLSTRISVVLMQQRPYVVRQKIHSAPLIQEQTSPQGTTR